MDFFDEDFSQGHSLVEKAAKIQKELLFGDLKKGTLRYALKENPDLRPFIGYGVGGQCLMFSSYKPLLENLWEVDSGKKEYGLGKELYRLQPDNALGAGLMMEQAAGRIAVKCADLFGSFKNLVFWELGSGNGATLAAISAEFKKRNLSSPGIIASDIDPKTQETAKDLFERRGLGDVRWELVDMASRFDMARVAESIQGATVVLLVGYIYHENRDLAARSLSLSSEIIPWATIAASEYLRPQEDNFNFDQDRPSWFEAVHDMTQDLFEGKDGFLKFTNRAGGYKQFDEIVHQRLDGHSDPLNATLFLKKSKLSQVFS